MTQANHPVSSLSNRPRLLVAGFGAFPGFPANPSGLTVERLADQGWAPEGTDVIYEVLPTTWRGAVNSLRERIAAAGAGAVLLTGVAAGARAFRVEMRAQNRVTTTAPDAENSLQRNDRISPLGPAVLRTTAPVDLMLEAIRATGHPAESSSDCGDYLCNYAFYRLLADREAEGDGVSVAFLHLPPAREAPPQADPGGAAFSLQDLEAGVKAAAGVMARSLIHAPRLEAIDA